MTLEEINRRLKKNLYYEGSQAQKEAQAGVTFQGDNVIVPEQSRQQVEQIRQEYGNGNTDNTFSKRDYSYININEDSNNRYSKMPSIRNIIETPRTKERLNRKKRVRTNDQVIKNYQKEVNDILRSKEYNDIQNWLNTDTKFKQATLSEKYNQRKEYFDNLNIKVKELNKKIDDVKKENIDLSEITEVDRILAPLNNAYTNVQSTYRGIANMANRLAGNKELLYEGITPEEYKAQKVREEQSGIERTISDVSGGIGQVAALAPVSMIPGVGKGLSLVAQGMSSGGESYKQSLEEGKNDKEALTYATLVGTSNALLQKVLGGIKIFGNSVAGNKVNNVIDKVVKSEVGKKSLQYINDALGEGAEEYLEEILEPVYRNISFNEKNKVNLLDENALYSGLIGSLTSGVMNLPSYVKKGNNAVTQNDINVAKQDLNTVTNKIGELQNNRDNPPRLQLSNDTISNNIIPQNENYASNSKNNITQADLPIRNYQYIESDNSKINVLRQDMSKYWKDTNEARALGSVIEKVISDKDYSIRLDDTINKNGTSVNAQITTLKNGEVEIKINPNAQNVGEFLLMHEVTHAVETPEMRDLIIDYASKNKEFNQAVESLKKTYNTNEVSSEVVADISGQLFGNQEFINNLSVEKPNVFKRIYNKVIELANKFTGNSRYDLFLKDLKNKWETAYRTQNNNLDNDTYYSIAGKRAMNNAIMLDSNNVIIEQAYNKAIEMANNNIDNETIRKTTNWFRDKNGDWKFEFSDKDMSLKNVNFKEGNTYKLGEILEHKRLFMLYPELKDYNIIFKGNKKQKGSFNRLTKEISLNSNIIGKKYAVQETLIHEIQHAIQNLEGFEGGKSSKGSKLAYYNKLGEIEADDTKQRYIAERKGNLNRYEKAPETSKKNPKHSKLDNYLKNRKFLDKMQDGVYNYFKDIDSSEVNYEENYTSNQKNNYKDNRNIDRLVLVGRHLNDISKKSISNEKWQEFIKNNYKASGTRTNLQDIKLPTKEWLENHKRNIEIKSQNNVKKVLNPTEISNLTVDDVSTTPKLPNITYKTQKGNNSKFYNNLMSKTDMLNDNVKKLIKNENDVKYYQGVTNEQSLAEAYKRLSNDGAKETIRWFSKDLSDENVSISASEVAEGWILLKQYQDAGDYESAVNVAKRMRDMATKTGQTLQAYSIQARLTPEGMFQYAQSELQEAFEKFSKNKTQEWIDKHKSDFDLKPEETQAIIDKVKEAQELPENSYEKKEKLAEINKIIKNKLPPERGAGIKAWMRISMLFNPKTQVRNVGGNAVIAPVNAVADTISTMADKIISKKTDVRTTGLSNPVQNIKGFKKGLYDSYNDFKKGINTREISGDRFEIGQGKSFKDKGLGKALNKVDNLLSFVLDVGDRPFYEATFTNSINNQLVLNNTDVVTQDMIDIATNEALSRTWQDNNGYTKAVLGIREKLNKLGNIKGYGLGDIFIPFAKTPANLTKAIVDYSPVGLVNTIVEGNNIRKAISRNDLTAQQQHKFVQNLGKATAGTMLYILGYALAKSGITSGESDEDKDVANFMKNNLGISNYSIKIGDKTFTYDWAQPVAAPIAMMSNFVNKKNTNTDTLNKILDTLDVPMNMLLEQSFMSSIKDVFSNSKGLPQGIFEEIGGLPSRAVPTLLKQITDLTDSTQRTTYEKGKTIETAVNQVKAKIPGLSKQLAPVSNTLGQDVKKYGGETNPFLYAFHTFINPANVNSNQKNKVGIEIYKVYQKTGDKTIFPRQAEYSQTIDGNKITLTSQERYRYQKNTGEYYNKVVNQLLKNNTYKKLSDKDKAKILTEIASDSNEIAKEKLSKIRLLNYERQKTDVRIDELVKNGLEYSNAYIYKTQIKDIEGDKDKNDKAINGSGNSKKAKYIMDLDTNDIQKDKLLSLLSDSDTIPTVADLKKLNGEYLTYMQQSGSREKGASQRDKYMIYIDAGIPVNTLNQYYSEIGKIEGIKNADGKTISGSKKSALFNYINNLSLNTTQKKILFTKCNASYGKSYKNEIFQYINSLTISKQRKEEIWKELYE